MRIKIGHISECLLVQSVNWSNKRSFLQAVCGRIVIGQLTEKVVQWTESNVTAGYFSKEIQAEADRLTRLQG